MGTSTVKSEPVQAPPVSFDDNKHIFDGKRIPGPFSAYQLCDVQDPELTPLIHKPEYRKTTCSVSLLSELLPLLGSYANSTLVRNTVVFITTV